VKKQIVNVGGIQCGADELFLISGPCVIEEESTMMRTAEKLKEVSARLNIPVIFKSSYQKDNRSALNYYTGPGLEKGLEILARIKHDFGFPVLSVEALGETADQIYREAHRLLDLGLDRHRTVYPGPDKIRLDLVVITNHLLLSNG
jgi:3-deoxy-D-manno-octulosonic acid (KDO) 8-phosphate synthase